MNAKMGLLSAYKEDSFSLEGNDYSGFMLTMAERFARNLEDAIRNARVTGESQSFELSGPGHQPLRFIVLVSDGEIE